MELCFQHFHFQRHSFIHSSNYLTSSTIIVFKDPAIFNKGISSVTQAVICRGLVISPRVDTRNFKFVSYNTHIFMSRVFALCNELAVFMEHKNQTGYKSAKMLTGKASIFIRYLFSA